MSTWFGVRQSVELFFVHKSASGRKLHRLGSSRIPSTAPSRPSHCFRTSLCIKVVHTAGEMKAEELAEPVMMKKLALQDCRLLKSRAGDPATMPSKSLGNISAALIP